MRWSLVIHREWVMLVVFAIMARQMPARDFYDGFEARTTCALAYNQCLTGFVEDQTNRYGCYVKTSGYDFGQGVGNEMTRRCYGDVPVDLSHRLPVRILMYEQHNGIWYRVSDVATFVLDQKDRITLTELQNPASYDSDIDGDSLNTSQEIQARTFDYCPDTDEEGRSGVRREQLTLNLLCGRMAWRGQSSSMH